MNSFFLHLIHFFNNTSPTAVKLSCAHLNTPAKLLCHVCYNIFTTFFVAKNNHMKSLKKSEGLEKSTFLTAKRLATRRGQDCEQNCSYVIVIFQLIADRKFHKMLQMCIEEVWLTLIPPFILFQCLNLFEDFS